jgi:RNA polymerase sigma factor (sigma-70 family)
MANAEDFRQEAISKLIKRYRPMVGFFASLEQVRNFAIRAAINLAKDWRRHEGRICSFPGKEGFEIEAKSDFSLEEREQLAQLLNRLSEEERYLFQLRFEEERTLEEVASILSCSVTTCWKREKNIKTRLSEWLTQRL